MPEGRHDRSPAQKPGQNQLSLPDWNYLTEKVFTPLCLRCHNSKRSDAGIDLSVYEKVIDPELGIVVPGKPSESILYTAVLQGRMPKDGRTVPSGDIEALGEWIRLGAKKSSAGFYGGDWERKWWVEKTVRALRGGMGLLPDENIETLSAKTNDELIKYLMEHPLFGDLGFDFGLYFLGRKQETIRESPNFSPNPAIFNTPQVIAFANDLVSNNGVENLLTLDPKIPYLGSEYKEEEINKIKEAFAKVIDESEKDSHPTQERVCEWYYTALFPLLNPMGKETSFGTWFTTSPEWFGPLGIYCMDPKFTLNLNLTEFFKVRRELALTLIDAIKNSQKPKDPYYAKDAAFLNDSVFSKRPTYNFFPQSELALYLPNSSTNMNRRRASFVLKRFFCDDLTPIGIAPADNHTGGRHGSDVSCRACHYKLDPMAGFFRNNGLFFLDFSFSTDIVFDDLGSAKISEYQKQWQGTGDRKWNIGYIRSPTNDRLNVYGSELPDLTKIIQAAHETKKCVIKRLSQYFLGEDQAVDWGYLEYLYKNLDKGPQYVIKQVVLSNAFAQRNPQSDKCYDYAPGTDPATRPPCQVSFLLEKNCVSCHGESFAGGNLNLARWIKTSDGMSFPHTDENGNQFTKRETLTRVLDRVSTSDPNLQMPLRRHMSSAERQALFLWLQEELK